MPFSRQPESTGLHPNDGDAALNTNRRSLLIRLWLALIVTETVLLAVRGVIGLRTGLIDVVYPGVFLLAIAPIQYTLRSVGRLRTAVCVLWVMLGVLLANAAEIAARSFGDLPSDGLADIFDLLSVLVIAGPLLAFVLIDLRDRRQAENRLEFMAHHDLLTGLPNRSSFNRSLQSAIETAKASDIMAVLFIDLDRFKNVTDTFGHAFGDRMLVEASERLREAFRSSGLVSRPGGDEFYVLLDRIGGPQDAEMAAQQILRVFNQPFRIEGYELRISCSIGIALYPQHGEDAIALTKNADTAMYQMKELGKNGYRLYAAEMNDKVIRQLVMEEWLNKALEQDEFELHYQPQVNIFSNRMNGMEALIRWHHPSLGYIPPSEFIPIAEETGLIVPIGEWVLRTACKQNKIWQLAGFAPLKIAVNISPIQFHQSHFVQVVIDSLKESGLEPRYLELEITESIAMYHVDEVIEKLRELRELGVHISIDDFGTGYSSLAYLKKFPITKLKIAQQFMRDVTVDPDDAAIVQAIMGMAHSLNLNVIAEGVETEEQLKFLLEVRCKEIQGYIYSKPVPALEFTKLLQRVSASSRDA